MSRIIAAGILAVALVYAADTVAAALHAAQHPIKTKQRVMT